MQVATMCHVGNTNSYIIVMECWQKENENVKSNSHYLRLGCCRLLAAM